MNILARITETLRLMIGLPDYERYVAHLRAHHPEQAVPTRAEFIAERQNARYGGKSAPKCC